MKRRVSSWLSEFGLRIGFDQSSLVFREKTKAFKTIAF